MSILNEEGSPSNLQTALDSGLQNLAHQEQLTFTEYSRQALSKDGFVFWVATGQTMKARGSLHVSSERDQDEDQTIGVNSILFTSETPVTQFSELQPGTMWVTTISGAPYGDTLHIAFSRRGPYYEAAGIYMYAGFAVYPPLKTQLVNSSSDLPSDPIVSNSLPFWLEQNNVAPVYPSYLVPENIEPPYITAHIEPNMTEPLQPVMRFDWQQKTKESNTGKSPLYDLHASQLMRDYVRLTLYGLNNQQAIRFVANIMEYSLQTENFGFMTTPAIQDEKRTQVEIAAIAMKKCINVEVSYYQNAADAVARRLILSAACNYTPSEQING